MKPLKIDWDALEEAFNSQSEELIYYLDLVTGHVVLEGRIGDVAERRAGAVDLFQMSSASSRTVVLVGEDRLKESL